MIGSVVGNYKIIEQIGEGGMGSVFKGVDLMLEREVAIKMLRPELARQPNVVERFRTEAVTLAKLNHTNVATLHSFFRQGEDFFMVMEFVRGQTLDEVIRTYGAMECERAIQLFCMALEGIDHAHKMGIIHRDIKPANMMLTETGSIKVMDFGIARVLGTDRMTKVGHLIGTVEYMSPEQVRGEETDARSDIYSLGILLYEMLTGRVPFNSTSEYELMRCQIEAAPAPPRSHAPHIPLPVEQAIMRSLAKKRDARYQSASEFRTMLLQRNAGYATTPLNAQPVRKDYTTQVDQAVRVPPASGDVLKPTRLAADQTYSTAGDIKATRLGQADVAVAYPPTGQQFPAAQTGPTQPSFLSKLNWKHYAAAGGAAFMVLVAVVTGAFVLLRGGSKQGQEVVLPTTTTTPAIQNPAPQAGQTDPASAAVPSAQPPTTTPVPSQTPPSNQNPVASSPSTGNNRPRNGASKNENTNQGSQQGTAVTPPAQTHQPPKQEKVATSNPEPEKKEPEKKPEEKKRGLFGKIKDALTGGDKDKKKDPKKP
jgi:serine/threonine protein kinase